MQEKVNPYVGKISLTPLEWQDEREFAERIIRLAEGNGSLRFTEDAADKILDLAGSQSPEVQTLCRYVWDMAYSRLPDRIPLVDETTVEQAIPRTLQALETDFNRIWEEDVNPFERVYLSGMAEMGDKNFAHSQEGIEQKLTSSAPRLKRDEILEEAPSSLIKKKILRQTPGRRYLFNLGLFQRWVQVHKPLKAIKNEMESQDPLAGEDFNQGKKSMDMKDITSAKKYFRQALEKNPRHFLSLLFLGEILAEEGSPEGVELLKKAYLLDSRDAEDPFFNAFSLQLRRWQEGDAVEFIIETCMEILNMDPHSLDHLDIPEPILFQLGKKILEQKDLPSARSCFSRVLMENPDNFQARLHLGEVMLNMGLEEEAIQELSLAYQLNKEDGTEKLISAMLKRAEKFRKKRDYKGLLDSYEEILRIDPEEKTVQDYFASWYRMLREVSRWWILNDQDPSLLLPEVSLHLPIKWLFLNQIRIEGEILNLIKTSKGAGQKPTSPERPLGKREEGMPDLHWACLNGDADSLKTLLLSGEDVNQRYGETRATPLMYGVEKGNLEIVRLLIESGADVQTRNHERKTPLHIACGGNNLEIVYLLLMHKAGINLMDKSGETPLFYAVRSGNPDLVQLLIKNSSRVNHRDIFGQTPLTLALQRGETEIARILIENKADLTVKVYNGWTPLHLACFQGKKEMVELLLKGGARGDIRDDEDRTPLDIARASGHEELLNMLEALV